MVRDLRLRAQEIGDRDMIYQEQQKRNAWMWENALRRHNFVGFIGEVVKGITGAKLREGAHEKWIVEAKAKTKKRLEEKRKAGKGEDVDV